MSEQASPYRESLTLDYKGHPVRALMIKGVPFMALPDILEACGYNECAAEYVNSPSFPPFGKHVATEEVDPAIPGEPQDLVLLSPTGVYYWGTELDRYGTSSFLAWARRESKRLCPSPTPGDPAFFLALVLREDGWTDIPPGPPSKYSGWKREREDLKDYNFWAWKAAEAANLQWKLAKLGESGDGAKPLGL